jgi:hypothetical protein
MTYISTPTESMKGTHGSGNDQPSLPLTCTGLWSREGFQLSGTYIGAGPPLFRCALMEPQTLARCSISIRGPPTLSLSAAGYDFHMTVHYHGLTTEGPEHVVCDTRRGILHPKSPNRGLLLHLHRAQLYGGESRAVQARQYLDAPPARPHGQVIPHARSRRRKGSRKRQRPGLASWLETWLPGSRLLLPSFVLG